MLSSELRDLRGGWESLIIQTLDQVESIRSIWEGMQEKELYPVVNADIDRYLSVIHSSERKISPFIVLLKNSGRPQAMIIGRLEQLTIPFRIGYKALFKSRINAMTIVHGGILGQPRGDMSCVLIRKLMEVLQQQGVDVLYFNHLNVESSFYKRICASQNIMRRNSFSETETHWKMAIPQSIDAFYACRSKKHRKHLRQYQNKLEKAYPGQVKVCLYTQPRDVDRAITDAARISRHAYQSAMEVGFIGSSQKCTMLSAAAAKGWFRGYILYINEEPVAFRFALKYGRVYFGDGIGYDMKWKDFRVGTILFIKVLEQLCLEKTIDYYDFGFGDAEYKNSYGDECWEEATATYIYSPRGYPLLINLVQNINSTIVLVLSWLFQKTRLFAFIKRQWRRKLKKRVVQDK